MADQSRRTSRLAGASTAPPATAAAKTGGTNCRGPHLPRVLLQHPDLPEPVLPVLPEQGPQRRAAVVAGADAVGQEDPPARGAQPVVELVVLVAHHLGVEAADPRSNTSRRPGAHVDGVDPVLPGRVVELRVAHAERRRRGEGDRLPDPAPPLRRPSGRRRCRPRIAPAPATHSDT